MNNSVTLKNINRLAVPALISGIAEPVLSITDTAIIGNMTENSTASLAAVGIVGAFLSMLIWVFGQTRSVISSIISQALGSNQLDSVKSLPAQALSIVIISSLLIIVITYPNADALFKFYNASGEVLSYSATYYKIRVFGLPFTLLTIGIFGIFRGLQNTYYPMVIAIIGTSLNIILDIILVYGIHGLIPPLKIEGAAYASLISQLVMCIIAVVLLYRKTTISLSIRFTLNDKLRQFLSMFLNLVIRTIALNIALYFGSSFATKYGDQYIAAYTIAINIWFLAAFMIDGYASAGTILSGKLFGGKAYQELLKLSTNLIKSGILLGFGVMVIGMIFYKLIGNIFTSDPDVLEEFYHIFWIVLIMQPFCAIAFIFDGIFKGLGWMKYLRNVLLFSTFMIFIPVVLTLDSLDYKLMGIFIAFTLWIVSRSIPLIIKFYKNFVPLSQKM